MLDAICIYDEASPETYTVFKFQKLNEADIEKYRQSLLCPACKQKAYFRKASKDGRAACFGSRYHHADCKEFKPSKAKAREELAAIEVNQQLVDSDALMIDFSMQPLSFQGRKPVIPPNDIDKKTSVDFTHKREQISADNDVLLSEPSELGASVKAGDLSEAPQSRVATQGLEKLLLSLLRGSELSKSDLWVYTDKKYRWRAKNLFVNFADAEPTENGAPRMYWGTLSHSDKKMHWLNPADCSDLGIPIEDYQEALLMNFNIQDRRDFEGAGIMLFGKCFWNKDKTRKIIQLWSKDLSRLFIAKLED